MRTARHLAALTTAASITALVAATAACGGGDDGDGAADATTASSALGPAIDDTAPAATEAPAATDAPTTSAAPATDPPTTTTTPPPPAEFDLAALPPIITSLETAVDEADPLDLARDIGGFPYAIPVPEGSTLSSLSSDLSSFEGDEGPITRYRFDYAVVAPGGTVPDIDIELDDNGPGSLQVIEIWDPIMSGLGFERTNSTASDPGDPGGPNSVNHVYVPTAAVPAEVNGALGVPGNVFVWSDEDVEGGDNSISPGEILGGYRISAEWEVEVGEPVAIPLLAAVADGVPLPDGARLVDGTVRLLDRSPDAFEIDRGAVYVTVGLEWEVDGASVDDLVGALPAPDAGGDGPVRLAEASFGGEATFRPAEGSVYDSDSWRQPLLLLDRYGGVMFIEPADEPGGPATISVSFDLNPADVELTPAG